MNSWRNCCMCLRKLCQEREQRGGKIKPYTSECGESLGPSSLCLIAEAQVQKQVSVQTLNPGSARRAAKSFDSVGNRQLRQGTIDKICHQGKQVLRGPGKKRKCFHQQPEPLSDSCRPNSTTIGRGCRSHPTFGCCA